MVSSSNRKNRIRAYAAEHGIGYMEARLQLSESESTTVALPSVTVEGYTDLLPYVHFKPFTVPLPIVSDEVGSVRVTGKSMSGKTTMLLALASALNAEGCETLLIVNPAELHHSARDQASKDRLKSLTVLDSQSDGMSSWIKSWIDKSVADRPYVRRVIVVDDVPGWQHIDEAVVDAAVAAGNTTLIGHFPGRDEVLLSTARADDFTLTVKQRFSNAEVIYHIWDREPGNLPDELRARLKERHIDL